MEGLFYYRGGRLIRLTRWQEGDKPERHREIFWELKDQVGTHCIRAPSVVEGHQRRGGGRGEVVGEDIVGLILQSDGYRPCCLLNVIQLTLARIHDI